MGKKVLFITPEIYPYMEENYISHLCRYLPQGIQEKENEIRTFMPKYGCVNERKNLLPRSFACRDRISSSRIPTIL